MGGGFASPALVPVVDAAVPPQASATAQSLVDSGTAVGVIDAGLVASAAAPVGSAWVLTGLACATTAVAVCQGVARVAFLQPRTIKSAATLAPPAHD